MSRQLARGLCAVAAGIALSAGGLAGTASAARTRASSATATFSGRLYDVAALSRSDAWAVGLHPNSSLIVHWNGKAWTQSLAGSGYFIGVAADSADDAWAVGGTSWFRPSATLIEHWNGKTWAQVPSPSPAPGGFLNAVTAVSADDAWAVGQLGPGPGIPSATTPLIEHWNGTAWTRVRCPLPAGGGNFRAVTATSASDVWAIGSTGPASEGTDHQALIEHWNGTAWSRVTSPASAGTFSILNGVAATSYRNAWAVGFTDYASHDTTLIEHWNGKTWTVVPSPTPSGDAEAEGVSATRSSNAWAVGMTRGHTCSPQCATFIEHWNGKTWTVVPSPNPPASYLNALFAVSATGRGSAFAVGTTDYAATLIARWNGKAWS
jgi:hypothetical protein